MNSQIIPAKSLFELHEIPLRKGKPDFANLEAVRLPGEFSGNKGIYGVFYNDVLIYTGISFNLNPNAQIDPIIERWQMHLTYFALRSPHVCFSPRNMHRILNYLEADFVNAYRNILGKQQPSLADLKKLEAEKHPLLNGRSSSFKKARFAANNWPALQKNDYIESFSFTYKALPLTTNDSSNSPPEKDNKQMRMSYSSENLSWWTCSNPSAMMKLRMSGSTLMIKPSWKPARKS